jgi:hypothetical protein
MKYLLFHFLVLISLTISAQNQSLMDFNQEKDKIGKRSMYALGGWALGNFVVSGAATSSATGSDLYFHQMNLYWNTINVGLAAVGLIGASKGNYDKTAFLTLKGQTSTEKIYLLNAGLDLAYITGGLYMAEIGKNGNSQKEMFQGYGYSIALQGGFLLVLDTVMYLVHTGHRKKKLDPLFENLELSMTHVRLRF